MVNQIQATSDQANESQATKESPRGLSELLVFLSEGKHLQPDGTHMTLRQLKLALGPDVPVKELLRTYLPNTSAKAHAASTARMLRGGQ